MQSKSKVSIIIVVYQSQRLESIGFKYSYSLTIYEILFLRKNKVTKYGHIQMYIDCSKSFNLSRKHNRGRLFLIYWILESCYCQQENVL